jgi:hypothetical protein
MWNVGEMRGWLTLAVGAVVGHKELLAGHARSRRELGRRIVGCSRVARRHSIGPVVAGEGTVAAGIHFGRSRLAGEGKGCDSEAGIAGCIVAGHRIGYTDRRDRTL